MSEQSGRKLQTEGLSAEIFHVFRPCIGGTSEIYVQATNNILTHPVDGEEEYEVHGGRGSFTTTPRTHDYANA